MEPIWQDMSGVNSKGWDAKCVFLSITIEDTPKDSSSKIAPLIQVLDSLGVFRGCLNIAFSIEKRDFFLEDLFGDRSKLRKVCVGRKRIP